ncbi:unnamed protein product [Owenia fusiformis]|uniref:Potassium channel domain-containing protein n=1 Tax=Owenia fusiformis TaxID=6347 RepID=A0A8S4Q5M3_OWEFU|nr:unnamed protein product [Owenia fusiformis]
MGNKSSSCRERSRCCACCRNVPPDDTPTHALDKNLENPDVDDPGEEDPDETTPAMAQTISDKSATRIRRSRQCKTCCKKFTAFLFSHIGLMCLVVAYSIFGGFIFMSLESPQEELVSHGVHKTRKLYVERLWNLTERLNILYKKNWSLMADDVMKDFQEEIRVAVKYDGWDGQSDGKDSGERQWTFAGALLYSITVITTIGYGHIAPKTGWGRVCTMFYALVGIPLNFLFLANIGSFLANAFRFLYKNICLDRICSPFCRWLQTKTMRRPKGVTTTVSYDTNGMEMGEKTDKKQQDSIKQDYSSINKKTGKKKKKVTMQVSIEDFEPSISNCNQTRTHDYKHRILKNHLQSKGSEKVRVPLTLSFMLIVGYIFLGAALFTMWEDDWDYLIGSYFCFITLTTIGFGDFVPGTRVDSWDAQQRLIFCCLYLVFGLALIAMCFDLMQDEVRQKFRWLGQKIGLLDRPDQT